MTHKLLTPAASLAAIAAAMTFATTPALSQPDAIPPQGEASPGPAPVLVPPPVVSSPPATVDSIPPATAPSTATPPAPGLNAFPTVTPPSTSPSQTQAPGVVYKPSTPVVQDVPVTEEASPAEEAALASPRSTQRAPAQGSSETPRRAATTPAAPTSNNIANDEVAEPTPAAPAESGAISPLSAPGYTGAANADLAPPAAADEAQAGNTDVNEGVIIGGAAILLLGTGGLAWTALRRRRRPADRTARPVVAEKPRTVDAPATAMAPLAVAPVAASEPVRREEVSAVAATSTAPEPVAEAVAPVTPSEVHARDAETTVLERPAVRRTAAADSDLEAMVAAQPDAANPFLTRRNRLRRAKYIMDHGEYVSRPISQREETQVAAAQAAPSNSPSRSQPPVYDFGKGAGPQRRSGWKPATST